ncbi:MAG: hypothetical protein M1823_007221, partial [Watsoniomyces obsoletus]
MSGAKELDPEARTIKYFAEPSANTSTVTSTENEQEKENHQNSSRVFIHPSSTLFSAQTFPSNSSYIAYFTLLATSKTFVRDLTPFNTYTLLLFGGNIEVDVQGGGMMVDGWLRLRGWARIGVYDRLREQRAGAER